MILPSLAENLITSGGGGMSCTCGLVGQAAFDCAGERGKRTMKNSLAYETTVKECATVIIIIPSCSSSPRSKKWSEEVVVLACS